MKLYFDPHDLHALGSPFHSSGKQIVNFMLDHEGSKKSMDHKCTKISVLRVRKNEKCGLLYGRLVCMH